MLDMRLDESAYDLSPDAIRDMTMSDTGFVLLVIHNMMRVTPQGGGTLREAEREYSYERYRNHLRGTQVPVMRIVRAEDVARYNATSQDNYKAAWSGNPRSGEYDRSRDWRDGSQFQRLY